MLKLVIQISTVVFAVVMGVSVFSHSTLGQTLAQPVTPQMQQDENAKKQAFNDGNGLLKLGRYAEALAAYEKALQLDSTWAKADYGRGLALKGLRRHPDAIQAYQNAIRHDPTFGEAYFALGKIHSELEQFDEAISAYRKAAAHQPDSYKAFYELGLAYDKKNLHREAAAAFRRARRLDSKSFWAAYMLATTLNRLEDQDAALAVVDSALALKENLHLLLSLQAQIYNAQNQPQQALEAAQAALKTRAGYAHAAYEAGRALKTLTRYNEATAYFLEAAKDRAWKKNVDYELEELKQLRQK
ncbi:tetratricopeptide repeat protein [candidate division KSB1 bacterium]|nr:tetratricopeptide repeat protein [candidate division KSB1 bacterium]